MSRLFQHVVILILAVLLCALMTRGNNEKLPIEAFSNKGLPTMLRHRPWYSGKRDRSSINNEVRMILSLQMIFSASANQDTDVCN